MVTSLRSKWAAGKAVEGAYLNRYVTDEQRGRRPIFNATLRAAAGWLFFRVARSTRMSQIWALRSRLEKTANRPAATSPLYARRCTSVLSPTPLPKWVLLALA